MATRIETSPPTRTGVKRVQHVRKWCREFENRWNDILDGERTG